MDETQSFRLHGRTDIRMIDCDQIDGQNVVLWDDIQLLFSGVKYVLNDKSLVKFMKDSNGQRLDPLRIKCYPGVVLDVYLADTDSDVRTEYPLATSSLAPVGLPNDTLINLPASSLGEEVLPDLTDLPLISTIKRSEVNSTTTCDEPVPGLAIVGNPSSGLSSSRPLHSTIVKTTTAQIQLQLTAAMERAAQSGEQLDAVAIMKLINTKLVSTRTACTTSVVTDESQFREYMVAQVDGLAISTSDIKNMIAEVLQNQQLMLDRLALIQRKAEAILVQNYELLEYTIPRLFIVLPETSTPWNPANMLRTKFRLHFICECGEHTKAAGSTMPNHLHLAKHEGYVLKKPTEFFEKYGPFLMLMLEMFKMGANIAGIALPAVSSLKVVDILDSTLSAVSSITTKVIEGVNYSLAYLEQNLQNSNCSDVDINARPSLQDLTSYLNGVEGLEGTDLRQLGSFLSAINSDNLLGNLYRMTTDKGHVKWVCIDHYRSTYKESDQQAFTTAVHLNEGSYDPQLGKVIVNLRSRIRADEFLGALARARRVDELDVTLDWECERKDLETLKDALKRTSVSILRVDIRRLRFGGKLMLASIRYEPVTSIINLQNMKMIHIVHPKDFDMISNFQLKKPSHIRNLTIELRDQLAGLKEVGKLAQALKSNSTLTTLELRGSKTGDDGAQALAQALRKYSTLTELKLESNWIGLNGGQGLAEALKTNSTLTTLDLANNSIKDQGALGLAEALKATSALITLVLQNNSIGSDGAQALAKALKTNSLLATLDMANNPIKNKGAQALAEALKINLTLTTLNMHQSSIGFDGAQALAEALKMNSVLATLDMANNPIKNQGAQALAEALKINLTLTTLNLYQSSIGPDGAQELAEALKINSILAALNLSNNVVKNQGALALADALKINSTLTALGLSADLIGHDGAQALAEVIKISSSPIILDLSGTRLNATSSDSPFRQ